jgi:Holliday junction resolvasome RuvABC DNA-binding subunit
MIKYCQINVEKLLQFKFNPIEEVEDDEDVDIYVEVLENGDYVLYGFNEFQSLETFLIMLEMDGINYKLLDEDGNVIDEENYDFDDDEY